MVSSSRWARLRRPGCAVIVGAVAGVALLGCNDPYPDADDTSTTTVPPTAATTPPEEVATVDPPADDVPTTAPSPTG